MCVMNSTTSILLYGDIEDKALPPLRLRQLRSESKLLRIDEFVAPAVDEEDDFHVPLLENLLELLRVILLRLLYFQVAIDLRHQSANPFFSIFRLHAGLDVLIELEQLPLLQVSVGSFP